MNLFSSQLIQAYLRLCARSEVVISMVLTIGLTLGAIICALTLVYLMLFKPLSYSQHEQLQQLNVSWLNGKYEPQTRGFSLEQAEFTFKQRSSALEFALSYYITDVILSLKDKPSVESNYVTNNWFERLNATAYIGHLQVPYSSLAFDMPYDYSSYASIRSLLKNAIFLSIRGQ